MAFPAFAGAVRWRRRSLHRRGLPLAGDRGAVLDAAAAPCLRMGQCAAPRSILGARPRADTGADGAGAVAAADWTHRPARRAIEFCDIGIFGAGAGAAAPAA